MSKLTRWLVIGGGTAGCVVASRLSEDPDNDVVLLEAGPDHGPAPVPDRGGAYLEDDARLVEDLEVVRRPDARPEPYPQGFGLGGTSLISGGLASPDPELFAVGHLLPLEKADRLGMLGAAVLDADARARPAMLIRRNGRRVTTADVYLRPALHRTNLMVVTESPVLSLALDGWRVARAVTPDGIEYAADRFVVCAGAIGTPTLLLRSGLDTPGIGEGLQDHPACAITVELGAGSDVEAPTITVMLDRGNRLIVPLNHVPHAPAHGALLGGVMSVTSVGRVSLPDRDGPPQVELRQMTTDADVEALTDVVVEMLQLLETEQLRAVVRKAYIDDQGTPADTIASDRESIREWATSNVAGFHHLSSTCREGVVTDPLGRVLGYENLFICDASLFPKAPPRTPYMPLVQMAERLSGAWRSGGS
jgi:choline dehydrogenase/5-(hydroxymethyl)furfural/furfural oxidase